MSWLRRVTDAASAGIGPGRLVLVVGPSGAGKDTLIEAVRALCADDPDVVFPRRLITREAAGEDHDTISRQAFERAAADGAFAFFWEAHGLSYALPLSVEHDIQRGRTVVCNISRAVVPALRERYAQVCVVLVTAPADVLAARLAARGRASDGPLADRLGRKVAGEGELRPDVVIDNAGAVEAAAERLLEAVRPPQAVGL